MGVAHIYEHEESACDEHKDQEVDPVMALPLVSHRNHRKSVSPRLGLKLRSPKLLSSLSRSWPIHIRYRTVHGMAETTITRPILAPSIVVSIHSANSGSLGELISLRQERASARAHVITNPTIVTCREIILLSFRLCELVLFVNSLS